MESAIRYTHIISVVLFLLLYLVKTILLLGNKEEGLAKLTKIAKVPEMIISTLFLVTGVYMLTQIPEIKSLLLIKIVIVLASIPIAIVGFKKKNKALATLSLIMIIAAYGLAEMSKKQASKSMEAITESTVNGQELYNASCTACHGADGKLGQMGAPDLTSSSMDVASRIEVIKNGKGAMAAFGSTLTEEQIKAVAEYSAILK